jgi:hypothetical protein
LVQGSTADAKQRAIELLHDPLTADALTDVAVGRTSKPGVSYIASLNGHPLGPDQIINLGDISGPVGVQLREHAQDLERVDDSVTSVLSRAEHFWEKVRVHDF